MESISGGYPLRLKYKVWTQLESMSPQAWNIDHLLPVVSTFGVLLDHSPMTNVHILHKIMVVTAVHDLPIIPRSMLLWVRGITRNIKVTIHSWIEEPVPFVSPP